MVDLILDILGLVMIIYISGFFFTLINMGCRSSELRTSSIGYWLAAVLVISLLWPLPTQKVIEMADYTAGKFNSR